MSTANQQRRLGAVPRSGPTKRRAINFRYNHSAKGKARVARYAKSDKCRAKGVKASRKYRRSEAGKIIGKLIKSRPDEKLRRRLYMQKRRAEGKCL